MQHTATEAEQVLSLQPGRGDSVLATFPVLFADPVAAKVGLGSPTEPRRMWVVYVQSIYSPPPGAIGPIGQPTPGTRLTAACVIDDATLKLGGNFGC